MRNAKAGWFLVGGLSGAIVAIGFEVVGQFDSDGIKLGVGFLLSPRSHYELELIKRLGLAGVLGGLYGVMQAVMRWEVVQLQNALSL